MPTSPRAGGRRRLGGLPPYHFGRFRASSFPIFRASSGGLIFVVRPTNPDCHGRELMTHKDGASSAALPRISRRSWRRWTRRPSAHGRAHDVPGSVPEDAPPAAAHDAAQATATRKGGTAAATRACPLRGDGGLCYLYNDGGRVPPAYNVGHRRARHADIVSDNGYLSDGRICRYLSPHPAHQRRVVFAAARRGHLGQEKSRPWTGGLMALWGSDALHGDRFR